MFALTVHCTSCGRKVNRTVDEACPPSFLRCPCGARFSLKVDDEREELNAPACFGVDEAAGDELEIGGLSQELRQILAQ